MFAGNFAPAGWAICDGSLQAINSNFALFNLIGTTYGGDGQNTFGLPDLRGRGPMHIGGAHTIGELAGQESVTLGVNQIPSHNHVLLANATDSNAADPAGAVLARGPLYKAAPTYDASLDARTLDPTGGTQPHDNMAPFLTINFIIALQGVFPSQF
jgi:microcystin-dependent protein